VLIVEKKSLNCPLNHRPTDQFIVEIVGQKREVKDLDASLIENPAAICRGVLF